VNLSLAGFAPRKPVPTYDYTCTKCHHSWELEQRIVEDPVRKCPKCRANTAKRQISSGAGFILKGGGWYADGYGSKKSSSSESKTDDKPSTSESKTDKKADSSSKTSDASASDKKTSSAEPKGSDKPKSDKKAGVA
jgi:putative FmdB family regulatory protein